jgi:hypothetical protein
MCSDHNEAPAAIASLPLSVDAYGFEPGSVCPLAVVSASIAASAAAAMVLVCIVDFLSFVFQVVLWVILGNGSFDLHDAGRFPSAFARRKDGRRFCLRPVEAHDEVDRAVRGGEPVGFLVSTR